MRTLIQIIETATEWPARIEGGELARAVYDLHHSPQDFDDGDIEENITDFGFYDLKRIPVQGLHTDYFEIRDGLVDAYAQQDAETAPPIIYDPTHNLIIDGNHRAKAAARRGDETILAYVGDPATYDPAEHNEW